MCCALEYVRKEATLASKLAHIPSASVLDYSGVVACKPKRRTTVPCPLYCTKLACNGQEDHLFCCSQAPWIGLESWVGQRAVDLQHERRRGGARQWMRRGKGGWERGAVCAVMEVEVELGLWHCGPHCAQQSWGPITSTAAAPDSPPQPGAAQLPRETPSPSRHCPRAPHQRQRGRRPSLPPQPNLDPAYSNSLPSRRKLDSRLEFPPACPARLGFHRAVKASPSLVRVPRFTRSWLEAPFRGATGKLKTPLRPYHEHWHTHPPSARLARCNQAPVSRRAPQRSLLASPPRSNSIGRFGFHSVHHACLVARVPENDNRRDSSPLPLGALPTALRAPSGVPPAEPSQPSPRPCQQLTRPRVANSTPATPLLSCVGGPVSLGALPRPRLGSSQPPGPAPDRLTRPLLR